MASANNFAIKIRGKSGRAALPHTGIDPVPVACEMVQAFQTILTRSKKSSEVAVISVTHDPCGEGQ